MQTDKNRLLTSALHEIENASPFAERAITEDVAASQTQAKLDCNKTRTIEWWVLESAAGETRYSERSKPKLEAFGVQYGETLCEAATRRSHLKLAWGRPYDEQDFSAPSISSEHQAKHATGTHKAKSQDTRERELSWIKSRSALSAEEVVATSEDKETALTGVECSVTYSYFGLANLCISFGRLRNMHV